MRLHILAIALLAGALVSCGEGSADCKAPAGCLSADLVDSTCQCTEWQVVSVENVPVKFVVVNLVYGPPGNQSEVWSGHTDGHPPHPPADSEIGSRWRSVVRAPDGAELVAALERFDAGYGSWGAFFSYRVTPASGATGKGSGWAEGHSRFYDIPSATYDQIEVWVNPVAILTTDYIGNRRVEWSWSASCYSQWECLGASTLVLTPGEIDGTTPPFTTFAKAFLDTLTPAERAAILSYHPLYDPPGRDPATIASDPRFLLLGTASLAPGAASYPSPAWKPCDGTLSDADFPVLAQMEVPFGWGSGTLLVQHSVQSISATCETQTPGMVLGTSTPSCALTAQLYLDMVFGTVLPILVSATPECTLVP